MSQRIEPYLVRRATLEEIIDLRWRILRAGLPRETAIFDGDREPTTIHFAAIHEEKIVGCVTVMHHPWLDKPAWQLRGMAVELQFQRSGIGHLLLQQVELAVANDPHSHQLWCNARTTAVAFYRKHRWQVFGDEFIIPTAGPHFIMTRII